MLDYHKDFNIGLNVDSFGQRQKFKSNVLDMTCPPQSIKGLPKGAPRETSGSPSVFSLII